MKYDAYLAVVAVGLAVGTVAHGAEILLNANDASGTSSFNAAGNWSNAQAPSAGNTYRDQSYILRSLVSTGATFAGDSLQLDGVNGVGGRFLIKGNSGTTFTVNNLILNGGLIDYSSTALLAGDTVTLAGAINVTANSIIGASSGARQTLNIDAVISGAASLNLTGGSVPGTTALRSANTLTGATIVSNANAVLNLGHQNALQNSTLTMLGSAAEARLIFDSAVSGNAFTLGGLAADTAGVGNNMALQNNAASPAAVALTVGGNNSNTTYAAVLSGSGSLIKTGGGTLTLSASNTFSGALVLSNGVLALSGAGSLASSNLFLASPATLDVTGRSGSGTNLTLVAGQTLSGGGTLKGGLIVQTNATLLPSATINSGVGALTLTNGNLTLAGTYRVNLASTSSSFLNLSGGALTWQTGASLAINDDQVYAPDTRFLIATNLAAGSDWGTLTNTTYTGSGAGHGAYTVQAVQSDGQTALVLTAVPEPLALSLLGLLGTVGWLVRRRRA